MREMDLQDTVYLRFQMALPTAETHCLGKALHGTKCASPWVGLFKARAIVKLMNGLFVL